MRKGSTARRIALYLGNELPPEVMDYVIQTCARVQHELTVLTFETENCARALLEPHRKALEAAGVDMKLVVLSSEQPIAGLKRYLRSHPEVAFLACKDTGYLGRSYLSGTRNQNSLPVPVVVVTTQAQANHEAVRPATDQNRSSSSRRLNPRTDPRTDLFATRPAQRQRSAACRPYPVLNLSIVSVC